MIKKLILVNISNHCAKASKRTNTFSIVTSFANFEQRRQIMNPFVPSLFFYFLIAWMFHNRKLNDLIKKCKERFVRIGYRDYKSAFCELLSKDKNTST